jgi:hypothetical protein
MFAQVTLIVRYVITQDQWMDGWMDGLVAGVQLLAVESRLQALVIV